MLDNNMQSQCVTSEYTDHRAWENEPTMNKETNGLPTHLISIRKLT